MDERLVGGAAEFGIELSQIQMEQFRLYHARMVEWNEMMSLTRIIEWDHVVGRHFLDSLSLITALPPETLRPDATLLDVGSGAGLPGVPLKIVFPDVKVTLLEVTRKKALFLEQVVGELGLPGLDVRTGRAETLAHEPDLREAFDAVVARAVAKLNVLVELMAGFCRVGGVVLAQKGTAPQDEVRVASAAVETMGVEVVEVREVEFDGSDGPRSLVVLNKTRPTPKGYPRRPGMPFKRPL
jgi:16S rRNA (guanine527-N7)-methyltransferase